MHNNEEDDVLLTKEDDRIPQQATMIRKVAYAPSAPTYTGLFVVCLLYTQLKSSIYFVENIVKIICFRKQILANLDYNVFC